TPAGSSRPAWSADGTRLAVGGKTTAVYDATSGRRVAAFDPDPTVVAVAFAPSGQDIAVAAESGRVLVIPLDGRPPRRMVDAGPEGSEDVASSPDGKYLCATHGVASRLWNMQTGDQRKLRSHSLTVVRVAFSADSQWVATASLDGTTRL